MVPDEESEKETDNRDTEKEKKHENKQKKEVEETLLTEEPKSEEGLLLGGPKGQLLKPASDSETSLLTESTPSDKSGEEGSLLGIKKSTESVKGELLTGGPDEGELLTTTDLESLKESKPETKEIQEIKERKGGEIRVAFDGNLNERGKLTDSYLQLKEFLEKNNVKCFIYTNVLTQLNLVDYDCLIFACPDASRLNKYEMDEITRYVQNGGSLFLLSHAGGDKGRGTNFNDLAQNFGIQFINDQVFDEVHNLGLNSLPIIKDFKDNPIFKNIQNICFRAGCSIEVSGSAKLIIYADSIAEPTNAGVMAINEIKLGRVLASGSYEMFRNQISGGIDYESHRNLFLNMMDWLTENKNLNRFIQLIERARLALQKLTEKALPAKPIKKEGAISKFALPVLPPKPGSGIEDIDGMLFGFNELKENFQGLKKEVENNLTEISSIVKGINMGTVREFEKLGQELTQFREDRKDFDEAINNCLMELGKEIENLNKKIDKFISKPKKNVEP